MYTVVIERKVQKEIADIPKLYQQQIVQAIYNLQTNPRPTNCKKLSGSKNDYRIRIADYRIIYSIEDNILSVFVITVGHRKNIYR
jgi:mRNA interferase RelE/StbE